MGTYTRRIYHRSSLTSICTPMKIFKFLVSCLVVLAFMLPANAAPSNFEQHKTSSREKRATHRTSFGTVQFNDPLFNAAFVILQAAFKRLIGPVANPPKGQNKRGRSKKSKGANDANLNVLT